jgi:hypothetical protein
VATPISEYGGILTLKEVLRRIDSLADLELYDGWRIDWFPVWTMVNSCAGGDGLNLQLTLLLAYEDLGMQRLLPDNQLVVRAEDPHNQRQVQEVVKIQIIQSDLLFLSKLSRDAPVDIPTLRECRGRELMRRR